MRTLTRRAGAPFRTKSIRKLMRKMKQRGGQAATGTAAPAGPYLIKVPIATMNFNFANAVSTLPASFGTFQKGGTDTGTFTINLASKYSPANLPHFTVTGYVFDKNPAPGKYIEVQRQFGVQTAQAAAAIVIDSLVKTITISNLTRASNFPATANDTQGFALYIAFDILN